jgi:hypothetical protein
MSASPVTVFEKVVVISDKSFSVVYRIDGHMVTVEPLQILKGSTASREGERGRLVLLEWYAKELGLLDGTGPG